MGSQPSPLPAVGFRGQDGGQLQLHTAQIHTKKSNEAPRISHSHSCTSSPTCTAPAEHPAPTPYPPLPQFPLSDPFTCPATVGGGTQGCHQDLGDRTATAMLLGILISQPQTRRQNHSSTKKRGHGVGAQDRGGSPRASQAAPGQGEHNKPRGLPKIPILRCWGWMRPRRCRARGTAALSWPLPTAAPRGRAPPASSWIFFPQILPGGSRGPHPPRSQRWAQFGTARCQGSVAIPSACSRRWALRPLGTSWHRVPASPRSPPEPSDSPPAPVWLRCARRGRVSRRASAGWPRPPSLEAGARCERWPCRPSCSTEPSAQPTAIVLIPG